MFGMWKRWKPWKRWLVGSLLSFALLLLSAAGYLYYQIASIDVDEIIARHQDPVPGEAGEAESKELPSLLQGQVAQAEQFANKPIEKQDALDVAAILLKSGLSMKEIYYLTGKATNNLSNEEKQKIRDTLLAKLSADEIAALRSITTQYGKGLLILDPNYPIELVGVYDEAERKKIMAELEARGKAGGAGLSPEASPAPAPSSGEDINHDADPAKLNELKNKYQGQLNTVQAACSAKSQALISQIKSELKNSSLSMEQMQNTYLPKIAAAEADCDSSFNQTLAQAEQEFKSNHIDPTPIISTWKSEYESTKQQEQEKAMNSILK